MGFERPISRRNAFADQGHAPKIRVMIVDDSLIVRTVLGRIIGEHMDMDIVCKTSSAELALYELRRQMVDVILLDLEMPGMGGIKALPKILRPQHIGRICGDRAESKAPKVLIVSSRTRQGAKDTVEALSMGAADTLEKPRVGQFGEEYCQMLVEKIRALGTGQCAHTKDDCAHTEDDKTGKGADKPKCSTNSSKNCTPHQTMQSPPAANPLPSPASSSPAHSLASSSPAHSLAPSSLAPSSLASSSLAPSSPASSTTPSLATDLTASQDPPLSTSLAASLATFLNPSQSPSAAVSQPPSLAASSQPIRAMDRPPALRPLQSSDDKNFELIALGASTGGTYALCHLLKHLPRKCDAPLLITQHLPASFIPIFAAQLEKFSGRKARIAQDGMRPQKGEVLIAPGDGNLTLQAIPTGLEVAIIKADTPQMQAYGCIPSVNAMLDSLAKLAIEHGTKSLGIILSGMGHDGASGAHNLVQAGGMILAQDKQSSTVWGMPRSVIERGLASAALSPIRLAELTSLLTQKKL